MIVSFNTPKLVKCICGFKPDSGTILMGENLEPVNLGMVGVVQQSYPVFDHRTVEGNLKRASWKLPKGEAKDKIDLYLNHFDLYDKKSLYPCQLSGGQKQRLAIARQLLSAGHFLLI